MRYFGQRDDSQEKTRIDKRKKLCRTLVEIRIKFRVHKVRFLDLSNVTQRYLELSKP